MRQIILIVGILAGALIESNAQTFAWAKAFGGPGENYIQSIALDSLGNVYSTGKFKGTIDFDPGVGVHNVTSISSVSYDMYITKIDASGNFVWTINIGPSLMVEAIAIDSMGDIIVSGNGDNGFVDFDPGPLIYNVIPNGIFLAKYSGNGNFIWAQSISSFPLEWGSNINLDPYNNIYITGYTNYLTNPNYIDGFYDGFDPNGNWIDGHNFSFNGADFCLDIAIDSFSNKYVIGHKQDTNTDYLAKYNMNGYNLWMLDFLHISFSALIMDLSGNIYITGNFYGTCDFDPSGGVYNLTATAYDNFIMKLNQSGNLIWVKSFGGIGSDKGININRDISGNLYVTGIFSNTVDFDPGPGIFNLSSVGQSDCYILKLDSIGNFTNAFAMGSAGDDYCHSVVSPSGNIFTIGQTNNVIDFDPGPGLYSLPNIYNGDGFIQKLSNCVITGPSISQTTCDSFLFNGQQYLNSGIYSIPYITSTGCDSLITLNLNILHSSDTLITQTVCDSFSYLGTTYYTSGYFTNTFTSANGCDSLITLHFIIGNSDTNLFVTACNSYSYDGMNYYASGIYLHQFLNQNGCDSTVMLNLTINPSSDSLITQTSCNDFTLNGVNYTTSGVYTQYHINANGCDSLLTLNLTIHPVNNVVISQTACDSYTWNGTSYNTSGIYTQNFTNSFGCDSVVTLYLIINQSSNVSFNQTACDSFSLNGISYNSSGIYTQSFTNSVGCDSLVTLNLTVNPSTNSTITQTACNYFTLNGINYSSSGIYTQSFTNSNGCDSMVTLNLTINPTSTSTITQTSCDSFIMNGVVYVNSGLHILNFTNSVGCDSMVLLYLTINQTTSSTITQTACDSFIFLGNTYYASGNFIHYIPSANGCDSMIYLNLTINSVDTSVTQSGALLNANANLANYQWIQCNPFAMIGGATNQAYTATMNGDYAVIVSQNGCSDTSACYKVTGIGTESFIEDTNGIIIYPNPTDGEFTILSQHTFVDAQLQIRNSLGQEVFVKKNVDGKSVLINLSTCVPGIYLLEISAMNQIYRARLVKE